jgi:cobalt-zinc-cadmium efflux system outer membrane protein
MRKAMFQFLLFAALSACTVHPQGEREERQAALEAGKSFPTTKPSPLADSPTRDDLVHYAMLNNADLQQQYWQWRSAIEQIPIDGTQPTSLAISLGTTLNNGSLALDRTVITAANDPMTDIAFPGKLSTAARRSLENARAAGVRFRKTQFELRRKVLSAYDDYALNAELIRLGEENIQLLQTTATITEARSRSGMAGQQDVLKAHNEVDMAKNDVENMRSQLPIQQGALNALLNRSPTGAIPVPGSLPPQHPMTGSDEHLFDRAAKMNPELIALADEIRAKQEDIHLAKLQYYPDFDVAASTDLKGIAQSVLGEFTVPILRYEALHAAVIQAEANFRATEAQRRQTSSDLSAKLMDDIATLHDADRQLDVLNQTILPRSRQSIALGRSAYETGSASLLDLLDTERSLIDLERFAANLTITRDKRLAEIESIEASDLSR